MSHEIQLIFMKFLYNRQQAKIEQKKIVFIYEIGS